MYKIPLESDYETILFTFKHYGKILEIRMDFKVDDEKWEAWVTFESFDDALRASCNVSNMIIKGLNLEGALCETAPRNLYAYCPADWCEKEVSGPQSDVSKRTPKPPKWVIATTEGDDYNYFKFNKLIQRKVGAIACGDISRFGRKSVLIHANSATQSYMLCNLKSGENDVVINVKPHLEFSYGRGVMFNKDLHDFSEEEILSMCPSHVWKVKKILNTTMIVLTFVDNDVPSHLYIENERIPVRQFKQKPLQCYNCFSFGHPSRVCKKEKLCGNCSAVAHGECNSVPKCINCGLDHNSKDKKCPHYQIEEAALQKSSAEHISVGYARRLLNKNKSYAAVLKTKNNPSGSIQLPPTSNNKLIAPIASNTLAHNKATLISAKTHLPSAKPPSRMHSPDLSSEEIDLPDLEEAASAQLLNAPVTEMVHSPNKSPSFNKKRGRVPSLSPLLRHTRVPLTNRYGALSPDNLDNPPNDIESTKITVEIHQPPYQLNSKEKKKIKPKILRPSLTTKSSGNRNKLGILDGKTFYKKSSLK